ncbi:type II toxin-antitoxin system Phd/YefM family antitoxin [Haloferula sp. A504]|uniref:type II toxin-antitoxin system Phd/YefM family antitoxin n=1 Tax=Haloferula sp. A504 TaxID=3373601 RepID=UPI0031C5A648|nr:type II toxin-antitoxin system Phd/YefM family antitoxin [Verrucomicrobiaceae bacterium E54]
MESIGIFEAKTKLSSICERVARTGAPVLVCRRGKPLVVISPPEPVERPAQDVLAAWKAWTAGEPEEGPDFPEVWKERSTSVDHPFEDDDLAS